MAFDIPQVNVNIKPLALPDNQTTLTNLLKTGRQLSSLRGGGGSQGSSKAMAGKGDWVAIPDASRPEGYRLQWVPGSSEKSRANNLAVIQQAEGERALAADALVQEKLAKLEGADVQTQANILEDIRRNDVERLSKSLGVGPDLVIDNLLGGYQDQIAERRRAVQESSGLSAAWDSVKLGARGLTDILGSIGESPRERLARAEDYNRYREEIIESNAYLQDQELRRAAGEGPFSRITGSTGSLIGSVGSAVGELLPSAGAIIGAASAGASAGAAIGTAVAPGAGTAVGGLVGGLATGGGAGAITEQQMYVNRIAADPTLTEDQKVQAIEDGLTGAALVGGVTGAIPLNIGRIGGLIGGAATRAGIGATGRAAARAGSAEAAEAVLSQAARDQAARVAARGFGSRFARATGLTAAELSTMNAAGVVGQNYVYGEATGQDTPLTEGLGEALQQGLLAAPVFGLPRTGRRGVIPEGYDSRGRRIPEGQQTTPQGEVAVAGETQTTRTNVTDREFNRSFRAGLKQRISDGEVLDAPAVKRAFLDTGRTEADFTKWLDADANVIESARLGDDIITRLRETEATPTPVEAAVPLITEREQGFYDSMRAIKIADPDAAVKAVNAYIEQGGTLAQLDKILIDSGKRNAERRADPTNLSPGFLNKRQRVLMAEAMEDIRQAQGDINGGRGAGEGGSGAGETAILGRNEQVGAGGIDSGNPLRDSGVATDTGAPTDTVAGRTATELTGGDRAVESGGLSRTTEPDLGASQAADVPLEAAGNRTGERADTGRSTESAAAELAAASESTGSGERAELGSPSRGRAGADAGPQSQPGRRTLDIESAGRAIEETGLEPKVFFSLNDFELPGTSRIPDAPTVGQLTTNSVVSRLAALDNQALGPFTSRGRAPLSDIGRINAQQRALDVLVRDALGEQLTARQRRQLEYLRGQGVSDLALPENILSEVQDARGMGMDINARDIVESSVDTQSTIEKVVNRIWCGAI